MRRKAVITVAVLVAVSAAAVPTAGLAAMGGGAPADSHGGTNSTDGNATDGNDSVAPGERLSGVVGVQEAEFEGEVDKRAFGIAVRDAATNQSKASVVAAQFGDVEDRIEELRQRQQELNESDMSEGKYRAQVAQLSAEMRTTKQLANQTANESQGLPAELLESKGINATAIQTLKNTANELGGRAVAEIARSIAGPGAAPPNIGPSGPPGETSPGSALDNVTDGNVTDGNLTDGNVTEGNLTDNNQTDGQSGGGLDGSTGDGTGGQSDGSDGPASDDPVTDGEVENPDDAL